MNYLRELLLNNLGLKLTSVLLASLLWYNVAKEQIVFKTVSVPVEFVNVPSGLEISNDYTKRVDVHVSVDRGARNVSGESLTAQIDLQAEGEGEEIVQMTADNIQRPYGVEVLSVTPSRIKITLEKKGEKLVPVSAQIIGTPAPGYQVRGVVIEPSNLLVAGPASSVGRVSRAVTESINIEGRRDSLVTSANVNVEDPKLRIEHTGLIQVTVQIEEEHREILVSRLPVRASSRNTDVLDPYVSVRISVPKSFHGTLANQNIAVAVATDSLPIQPEPHVLKPEVSIDPVYRSLARVVEVRPASIRVRVLRR